MKKRPLPLISLVLCAIGLSLVLLGSALSFLEPKTPGASVIAICLFCVALIGVYIILKVFLLMDKLDEGSLIHDKKPLHVFCIVFLLVLLLALLLFHLYFGASPEETRRELEIIVCEDNIEAEESLDTLEEKIIENPPISNREEVVSYEEYNVVVPSKPEVTEEIESVEESVEPEIEETVPIIPPTPVF